MTSISSALYSWFASFYVFNLEYDQKAKCVGWFIQDLILGLPDSSRRAASYIYCSCVGFEGKNVVIYIHSEKFSSCNKLCTICYR